MMLAIKDVVVPSARSLVLGRLPSRVQTPQWAVDIFASGRNIDECHAKTAQEAERLWIFASPKSLYEFTTLLKWIDLLKTEGDIDAIECVIPTSGFFHEVLNVRLKELNILH